MANAGPSDTSHRNLAIRLISAQSIASASTFLLVEWPTLNFFFKVDFFLSSKREASFVSSLKAQPSPKLMNNVWGYVHIAQFPNSSGPGQVCSRETVSFMSICSHGTGTEMVLCQSTSGPMWENQLFVPISYVLGDQNAWKMIEEGWIYRLKEVKGLWPDNKLPYHCPLQNTQSLNLLLLAFNLLKL